MIPAHASRPVSELVVTPPWSEHHVGVVLCGVPPKEPHPTEFSVDGKTCPRCGAEEVSFGYGLAGGGMGPYESCDACDWFAKRQDTEGET